MKPSFALLALAAMAVMIIAIVTGARVHGAEHYLQHVLLGILTGLYVCFVHVVLLTYFVVQDKIMKQAAAFDGLDEQFVRETMALKSRAVRLAIVGIGAVILVTGLGAAIEAGAPPNAHSRAAFIVICAQATLFYYQFVLLDHYTRVFRRAFAEPNETEIDPR